MRSRLSFLLTALLISAGQAAAVTRPNLATPHFTIQLASFPDPAMADRFAVRLVSTGESPVLDTVDIEGRGSWTRVLVGSFNTADDATRYGKALVARGIIKEFLVKNAWQNRGVTRPRRVLGGESRVAHYAGSSGFCAKVEPPATIVRTIVNSPAEKRPASGVLTEAVINSRHSTRDQVSSPLPVIKSVTLRLAPRVDTNFIPRPDAVDLAFRLVTGELRSGPGAPGQRSGLWISGDSAEGMARLRWIIGDENVGLIKLGPDGRVRLDSKLLAKAAGLGDSRVEDPLRVANYISSNEGLLLLVQVAQGRYRYLLHIGRQAPAFGKSVEAAGSINLDNNVDSRINPYRKNGKKLDGERPPEGFDSLIGLNPVARWFNLSTNCWVQGGEIVFHELAEAYAKLELGLD